MRIKCQNIERKKRWTKWSQTNSEWNIIQRSLLKQSTPSLGHNTSLIKSTQIKDWLLSFEGFIYRKILIF